MQFSAIQLSANQHSNNSMKYESNGLSDNIEPRSGLHKFFIYDTSIRRLGWIVDAIIVLNHRRQLTTHMYVKHPHRTYQWMAEYGILTSVFRIRNRNLYVCVPAHITIRFLYMIPILIVIVAWTFKQNGDLV